MAKANLHPKTHLVSYVFPKGKTLKMTSTYGGDNFLAESSIFDHSAWRKDNQANQSSSGNAAKFAQVFGGLLSGVFEEKKDEK